jgi:hypothetical protein
MATQKRDPSLAKRFAEIERLSMFGVTERMGPVALHLYAEKYLAAAQALPPQNVPFDPVRLYLACHAIELCLKAFLSLHGQEMLAMADGKLGHKLGAILEAADRAGLKTVVSLSKEQLAAIRHAETYYAGKVFEYPAVGEALSGYPSLPPLEALLEAAVTLVSTLAKPCKEAK